MLTVPDIQTAVKTAVFKIHNPSRRKRAILDYALRQSHLAYSKALHAILPTVPDLARREREARSGDLAEGITPQEQRRRARQRKFDRERMLVKAITKVLAPLPIGLSAKAYRSTTGNLIGQVESHISLHEKQESVGLPTAQRLKPDPDEFETTLRTVTKTTSLEEENVARDRLNALSKAGQYRPLLLPTNRKEDGFLILKNPDTGRYFVYINLIPETSRFARLTPTERSPRSSRRIDGLYDIRTGAIVKFSSKTGCLFPIEFAREYQFEEFLRRAKSQSAKLVKNGDRYEVHVSFQFETPKITPETRLGVDRGIYNLASLTVIDKDGRIVERQNVDGRRLRFVQKILERRQREQQRRGRRYSSRARRFAADEAVHTAANHIVALALRHRAQVTLEDLRPMIGRGRPRARSNFNRVLNRSQYQKLHNVLAYKLAVAGLPPAQTVAAGYTSITCPVCGHADKRSRPKIPLADGFKTDAFRCVACGFDDDADLNASRIIALKKAWRESLPANLKGTRYDQLPEAKRFAQFLRDRAERRGEGACGRKAGTFGRPGLDGHEDGEVPPGSAAGDGGRPLSLNPDRTPRQGQNSPTMPSAVSSSSEILPLSEPEKGSMPDG